MLSREVLKTVECDICLELAVNPVVTRCGHLFCRSCLNCWTGNTCPTCTSPMTAQQLTRLYGRGRSNADEGQIFVGSEALRNMKRFVSEARSAIQLREGVVTLLAEVEFRPAALEEMREVCLLKIDSLVVALLGASLCLPLDQWERQISETVSALAWDFVTAGEAMELLQQAARLKRIETRAHDFAQALTADGDLQIPVSIDDTADQPTVIIQPQAVVDDLITTGGPVRLSTLVHLPPLTPGLDGVTKAILDCDPSPLVLSGVSKLTIDGTWTSVLEGTWESGTIKSVIETSFPSAIELTIQESHVAPLIASAPPKGTKVVNLTFSDKNLYDKLESWIVNNKLTLRGDWTTGFWTTIYERKFNRCIRNCKGNLWYLFELTKEGRRIENLEYFRKMLGGPRDFYFLPLSAPRAAYETFSFVFVLKMDVFKAYEGTFDAAFVKSAGRTTVQGFVGPLGSKREAALKAFEALAALHCKNLAPDEMILALLDPKAHPSGDLQEVQIEAVLSGYKTRQASRKWFLPEARTVVFDMFWMMNDRAIPSDFEDSLAWLRKLPCRD